ncbi:MAG: hypothetical protein ACI4P4_12205 [Faecousia sp.]
MKNTKVLVSLICVLALCLGLMAGCGSKTADAPATDAPTAAPTNAPEETAAPAAETEAEAPAWDAAAALEALVAANPAEDNYLVLSGIGGGWAPVVMVLDNDGNFICLVDYAGQATVNFATGTYEEAEDGSITATGTQYNTGEELIYEIACADGTYTTTVEVPDAGCSADLTGTK